MNFDFTEEQIMIQQAARDFAKKLEADVIQRDKKSEDPINRINELSELGLIGMKDGEEYRGGEIDIVSYVQTREEMLKDDSSILVVMSVINSLRFWGIEKSGNVIQKDKYLPLHASGEKIRASIQMKSDAKSDVTLNRPKVENIGDYYISKGTKTWITNAICDLENNVIDQVHPEKKYYRINLYVEDIDSPVILLNPLENKIGKRCSDTSTTIFKDSKVEAENRNDKAGTGYCKEFLTKQLIREAKLNQNIWRTVS
nr:acyl-CoA dehydrogenase family protein [Bacteroidota bacterium]